MLGKLGVNQFNWIYTNFNTLLLNPGTSVAPGASNVEGSWTQIATAGNVSTNVYGVFLFITYGYTAGQIKNHFLDFGVDEAGGTSYTPIISNIICGASSQSPYGGHTFYFPLFIKSGSTVAVRVQGSNATVGSLKVAFKLYGKPSRPELIPKATYSETIGTITNTEGVSVTPGTSAEGSWVSLGTTSKSLWYWLLTIQLSNATTGQKGCSFDLAYGDATNKQIILTNVLTYSSTTSEQFSVYPFPESERFSYVPAGSTLYVRGWSDGGPDSGYNVLATGLGG